MGRRRNRKKPANSNRRIYPVFGPPPSEVTVKEGDGKACFNFVFTNLSSRDVTITAVQTYCGCTTAKLPPLPWKVAARKAGQIPVDVDIKGQSGRITKAVTVVTLQGMKELTAIAVVVPSSTNTAVAERVK